MSTYKGDFLDINEYKSRFPNFIAKGIFIVGPFNKGKNAGIVDEKNKSQFIKLCDESETYFKNVKVC